MNEIAADARGEGRGEGRNGWMRVPPGTVMHPHWPLMRAVLAADDAGLDRVQLPGGRRVPIHSRLVSIAAGAGRCKSCGAEADAAAEVRIRRATALWFVKTGPAGFLLPMTSDHVVPESWGGATHADNLRCLCRGCNMGKADRLPPGVSVERRYHSADLVAAVSLDNPPGSPRRRAYLRFLKDRAAGRIGWLPRRNDYLDNEVALRMLRGFQDDYGLRVPRAGATPRLFPATQARWAGPDGPARPDADGGAGALSGNPRTPR